jgi:chemotaxis protein MotB
MGVFEASTTQVPLDASTPMPFSTVQAVENTERTASFSRIASRPEGSLGADVENGDLAQLQTQLEAALAGEIKRKEVAVHREADGLVVSLREIGFFESGSAVMKSTSIVALDRIAGLLHQQDYRLRIEGHTDNAPIHTAQFPSNWELSTTRATEIVRLLIVRDGFAPERLSAAGYAEYHPVAANSNAEGRSMNRRVDIVILGRAFAPPPLAQAGSVGQSPTAVPPTPLEAPKLTKPSAGIASQPVVATPVNTGLKQ